jgi:methionine-rich copper-binding protein CopC
MSRRFDKWISSTVLAAAVAGMVLLAGTSSRAAAMRANWFHVTLVKSDPKLNDTLSASPKAISLWFSESIQAGATAVRLTNADGKVMPTGKITVAPAAKSPAVAVLTNALKPGRYALAWHTMAEDGHPAKGEFSFVVR